MILERLCPLTLRRVDHARIENQKRVVFPLLLGFLQFRQRFVEQFVLNVHSYFPAGAKGRAEFISLPQQSQALARNLVSSSKVGPQSGR